MEKVHCAQLRHDTSSVFAPINCTLIIMQTPDARASLSVLGRREKFIRPAHKSN